MNNYYNHKRLSANDYNKTKILLNESIKYIIQNLPLEFVADNSNGDCITICNTTEEKYISAIFSVKLGDYITRFIDASKLYLEISNEFRALIHFYRSESRIELELDYFAKSLIDKSLIDGRMFTTFQDVQPSKTEKKYISLHDHTLLNYRVVWFFEFKI